MTRFIQATFGFLLPVLLLQSCVETGGREQILAASSCMQCHNGSKGTDYSGPGIMNPHPFPGADQIACVTCHGGNNQGADKTSSHVPPPPQIGDREYQDQNNHAWFNKLTLTGMDKFPDYTVDGTTYTALQYLQFVNPGDIRVTRNGNGCGQCHQGHSDKVEGSLLYTETGILGGAMMSVGDDNAISGHSGWFQDTAGDLAFRAVSDPGFTFDANDVGRVGQLIEQPVHSRRNVSSPDQMFNNDDYLAAAVNDDVNATTNRVINGSPLSYILREQFAFTCGDCHLGSSGANNRYGDFRSSGCTSCHMPYSLSGRSGSTDPNINKYEPLDVDDIDDPERPHLRRHRIVSTHKTLSNGVQLEGMDDHTCAGCHQGSNRTVMQFWGIRLDQNQDVRRNDQHPAQPDSHRDTRDDTRLFDPVVQNNTFNGRNFRQYLEFEDYDGDGRDDTPPDIHHQKGMGCIDCHGSSDLHGGDVNSSTGNIRSRMEQGVAIQCESCHGPTNAYATTQVGTSWDGTQRDLAVDRNGKVLNHVYRDSNGHFWLRSKLTGETHYVSQTYDITVDTGRNNPVTNLPLYSVKASYAMGRDDGNAATGIGPQQTGTAAGGFAHGDNLKCQACHSSWTNTCMGCHLEGEYNNNFSNITGERIVFQEEEAQFVYQSPVFFQLGVDEDNKITQTSSNTKMFFKWWDRQDNPSKVFAFSSRKGQGNSNSVHGALGHNAIMAHSIRGKASASQEGVRNCVACHLTTTVNTTWASQYSTFRSALSTPNYSQLDFNLLRQHIGQNPGNELNSPFYVHMVAGLGSGLFLFDANGAAVNPLDDNDNRYGSNFTSPADQFLIDGFTTVRYNMDRVVDLSGVARSASNHPMLDPTQTLNLRTGSTFPLMSGPLGSTLVDRLTNPATGIVLDAWMGANGELGGDAHLYIK